VGRRGVRVTRGALVLVVYLLSLTLYSILLRIIARSPLNMYVAAILAGLTGFAAAEPLDSALAAGLGGLTGHLLNLALDRIPGYIAGLASVIGWAPIIIGLIFSLATPAGVGILAWHAFKRLRGRSRQG